MTDTPIHDELLKSLEVDPNGGDRHTESIAQASPIAVPAQAHSRHRRA
ncbi:hypothetical protein [Rhodococcus sp. AW25M09]|nr:hypothetical protein [Rhodococcus sp. AW25M09]